MQQAGLYVTLDAHHAAVYTTATYGTGSWHPPYSCPCLSMLLTLGWKASSPPCSTAAWVSHL